MIFLTELKPNGSVNHKWPQIICIVTVSSFAITAGVLFAWTSPSIPLLISNSSEIGPLTLEDCSYFGVLPAVGVILSSPLIGIIGKRVAPKTMVMFLAVPQTIAFMLIIFATSRWELYLSRFLTGVGESLFFFSLPAYIGEIARPEVRGTWGSSITLVFFFGHLMINAVGSYFTIKTTAYIFVAMPIISVLLTYFLPESPYYYLKIGNIEKAKWSLQILRWRSNVDEEFGTLSKYVNQQSGTLKDLFLIRKNRVGLLIGIGTRVFQQASGFPAIVYYNQYIFNQSGNDLTAFESSIIYTSLQVILIAVFSYYSDKIGRRRALIFSSVGCGLSVAIEGVYFLMYEKLQVDVSAVRWLPLCGLILYEFTFAFGLSTVPTLLLGEVIDSSVKNHSLAIVNMSYATSMLICTKLFHVLSFNVGMFAPFWFYSICCMFSAVYCYYLVPETQGKTLYEIQQIFEKPNSMIKEEEAKTANC